MAQAPPPATESFHLPARSTGGGAGGGGGGGGGCARLIGLAAAEAVGARAGAQSREQWGRDTRIMAAAFVPPALQCPMRFISGRSATRTRPRKANCCAAASYLSLRRPAKAPHLRQYCCAKSGQLGTEWGPVSWEAHQHEIVTESLRRARAVSCGGTRRRRCRVFRLCLSATRPDAAGAPAAQRQDSAPRRLRRSTNFRSGSRTFRRASPT